MVLAVDIEQVRYESLTSLDQGIGGAERQKAEEIEAATAWVQAVSATVARFYDKCKQYLPFFTLKSKT